MYNIAVNLIRLNNLTSAGRCSILDKTDALIEPFYEKAVSAIASGISIRDFTRMCYHYFHIDLIVVDEGYRLIDCAGNRPYDDPYWEILADSGSPTEETIINDYLKEGYLETIAQSDSAIFVNWGVCRDYPQTSGPIYINGQLAGFLSLLFLDPERLDFALKLNAGLCRLYAILFKTNGFQERQTQNPIREVFAKQFFDTKNYPNAPRIEDYHSYINIRPSFLIAVVRSKNGKKAVLEHVRGRFRSFFPDIIYLHQEGDLYLFLSGVCEENMENIRNKLLDFLAEYQLLMGCSRIFDRIEKRSVYIQQAEYALRAGYRTDPDKQIFLFPDYYTQAILSDAADTLFSENAVPPELLTLCSLDAENQTDYTESLAIYLYERNNLNRAAAKLHLHRNTLKYRLDKITDLTGISPDEPDTALKLQMGFLMMELQKH